MTIIFSFLLSVMASMAAYYVCKWLDRKKKDNFDNLLPHDKKHDAVQ